MNTRGYGSYRGRSPFRRFLKILILVLVVLLLLGAAAAAYLQQFLVISGDGVYLDLPSSQTKEPSPPPSASPVTIPVVLTPEPTPTPTPTPEPPARSPAALPAEALYDGTALNQVRAAGGDCALFDMKTDTGLLNYISASENAVNGGLNPDDPSRNAAIRSLNETEGLYTIARVSCFKDHGLITYDSSYAIFTNSGYRWDDPDGIRWSSPTNPDTRQYLTDLCVELAELGFDEILLDNAGYPNTDGLNRIKKGDAYDASQFSTVIGGFYTQVLHALSGYDIKVSVVTTAEGIAGTDTLTGQTPDNLARMDRLWLYEEAGTLSPVTGSSIPSVP